MRPTVKLVCFILTCMPSLASADVTLDYRLSGSACRGDFDRLQTRNLWLRVDARMGNRDGSFLYDAAEKLAYALDHSQHQFMQFEVDEDATEFNADRMTSLRKMMRNQTGVDPFEQARTLCPGAFAADQDSRRAPNQPVDCNARAPSMSAGNAPASMPGMNAENMQAMQKLMQQQMASMTPEQRAQMQRGMSGAGWSMPGTQVAPQAETDRDLGPATIEGIACSRRQHLRGDEIVLDECLTTLDGLKLGAADAARITRMSRVMARWRDSMIPSGLGGARKPQDQALVQRVCYAAGVETGRATLHIDSGPVADARFAVPRDYAPMDLNGRAAPGSKP